MILGDTVLGGNMTFSDRIQETWSKGFKVKHLILVCVVLGVLFALVFD
jgi:hypothetical protein